MHLLADENISQRVIDRLRAIGADVLAVRETAPGASDDEVIALASAQGRTLITEDRDFGEMVVRRQLGVLGVVLLELERLSSQAASDRVAHVLTAHPGALSGNLLVIEPGRVRVRPLRHSDGRR